LEMKMMKLEMEDDEVGEVGDRDDEIGDEE
jgi:hypothetical protein